jgi:thiol-disulfide isomerase/thioredoxin
MKSFYTTLLISFFLPLLSNAQVQGIEDVYYKVPDITLNDIDGQEHNLYELLDEGKYVLIDLYTTWCQPCRDNAPFVEAWYEEHGPEGDGTVIMWNVECDDNDTDLQDVLDWIEEFSVTSINFEENDFFWFLDEFPYNGYPSYFMICPDRFYGKVFGQEEMLIEEMNAFINGCPELSTNETDARLLVFEEDLNVQCGNPSPSIRIENRGSLDLNTLTIETYVNGELDNSFNWTGNLSQYEEERVFLAQLDGLFDSGIQDISFELLEPNGMEDQNINDNTASGQFQLIDGATPSIQAGFGYGAQSYTFQIIDDSNELVFEHTFAATSSYGNESVDLCLANNACYTFKIIDAVSGGGAGFIFSQEFIDLQFEGEQLLYIDETNYAQQVAEFSFCIGDPTVGVDTYLEQASFDIYPNPSNGLLYITADDTLKSYELWHLDGAFTSSGEYDGTPIELPYSGIYLIKIKDEKGNSWFERISVIR